MFLLTSQRRATGGAVVARERSNRSCSETFATGAMRDGIRVGHFEAAFLQIVAVIEKRTAHEQRAFRIDNHARTRAFIQNVPIGWTVHQIHFLLEAAKY